MRERGAVALATPGPPVTAAVAGTEADVLRVLFSEQQIQQAVTTLGRHASCL